MRSDHRRRLLIVPLILTTPNSMTTRLASYPMPPAFSVELQMSKPVVEVISFRPVAKPRRLNRAQRRAEALLGLFYRQKYCPFRCGNCGDSIPFYYVNTRINPKWRGEVRRSRRQQRKDNADTCFLPRHPKHVTFCLDCYLARSDARRQQHQHWVNCHRYHPLDRLHRLLRWFGVDVDTASAWARYHASQEDRGARIEMEREIAETTAAILSQIDHTDPQPHPFSAAMEEMSASGVGAPSEDPDADATEAVVGIEIEIYRLTGASDLRLNDDGWRQLMASVRNCMAAWQRVHPGECFASWQQNEPTIEAQKPRNVTFVS